MSTPTTLKIVEQGAPIVIPDSARVVARGEKVAALVVDMESRGCEVWGEVTQECPMLVIESRLDGTRLYRASTVIAFPDFPGWEVFAAGISKFTLCVTLIHPDWRGA
jgi:hypothetical protein